MSTELYFAVANSDPINRVTFKLWDWVAQPLNVLVPFVPSNGIRSWKTKDFETPGVKTILDSGAFSAWKSGTEVSLDKLIEEGSDGWDEVAALDVIGDPKASLDNALMMTGRGFPVIPVFHYGEPWEFLAEYKSRSGAFDNRIGLGGIATGISSTQKRKWLNQAFARAYPARFHGFGVASEDLLMSYPFFTVDTASWHTGLRYGRSAALGDTKLPRKSALDGTKFDGSGYDLRFELKHYLEMIARVQDRWASELSWTK